MLAGRNAYLVPLLVTGPTSASGDRRRVLFVEDEPGLRRAYRRFFAHRYDMGFATTGEEARQELARFEPDVASLLGDWMRRSGGGTTAGLAFRIGTGCIRCGFAGREGQSGQGVDCSCHVEQLRIGGDVRG